jgi:hypothetical protein
VTGIEGGKGSEEELDDGEEEVDDGVDKVDGSDESMFR